MVSLGSLLKHIVCGQVFLYIVSIASTFQNYTTREDVYMSMDVDIGVPGDVTAAAMKYESIVGVSLESCVDHCKRRSFCSYISYATNAHMCSIIKHINKSQTATFSERAGYVLGKKAEWDMTSYTDCGNCTINETCVRDGTSTSCKHTACGPPEIPDNALLLGNMYNTGSRLLLRCMEDTWSPQGDQVQITCLSSGLWTSTDFSCLPETTTATTTSTTTSTTPTTTAPPTTTTEIATTSQIATTSTATTQIATTTTTTPTTTMTTTTSTPTTPPPFSCVTFGSSDYRTVSLTDTTTVKYKLVVQTPLSKNASSQECRKDGGELIKITSGARRTFITELTACRDMPDVQIWVDGDNLNNEAVWKTTDGVVIPRTHEFWNNGSPSNPTDEHCIRLRPGYDKAYKFSDDLCSQQYSYMCEI